MYRHLCLDTVPPVMHLIIILHLKWSVYAFIIFKWLALFFSQLLQDHETIHLISATLKKRSVASSIFLSPIYFISLLVFYSRGVFTLKGYKNYCMYFTEKKNSGWLLKRMLFFLSQHCWFSMDTSYFISLLGLLKRFLASLIEKQYYGCIVFCSLLFDK